MKFAYNVRHYVHDVGIALHIHEFCDLNCTRLADAANIVAPQVYQHNVFCLLLLVVAEFLL